ARASTGRDPEAFAAGERPDSLVARRAAKRVRRDVDRGVEIPEAFRFDLVLGPLQLVGHSLELLGRELLGETHGEHVVAIEDRALRGDAVLDVAAGVLLRIEERLLREQPGAKALRDVRVSGELGIKTRHDPKERALACAVWPEHDNLSIGVERERETAK